MSDSPLAFVNTQPKWIKQKKYETNIKLFCCRFVAAGLKRALCYDPIILEWEPG
jgi:hypothetical protein